MHAVDEWTHHGCVPRLTRRHPSGQIRQDTHSVGFTVGASTTKFVGRALNLKGPASIEGTYGTVGAGGAVAAGAGSVQLQNANGVILQLSGPRVGAEVSAAVGGVTVRLK